MSGTTTVSPAKSGATVENVTIDGAMGAGSDDMSEDDRGKIRSLYESLVQEKIEVDRAAATTENLQKQEEARQLGATMTYVTSLRLKLEE